MTVDLVILIAWGRKEEDQILLRARNGLFWNVFRKLGMCVFSSEVRDESRSCSSITDLAHRYLILGELWDRDSGVGAGAVVLLSLVLTVRSSDVFRFLILI